MAMLVITRWYPNGHLGWCSEATGSTGYLASSRQGQSWSSLKCSDCNGDPHDFCRLVIDNLNIRYLLMVPSTWITLAHKCAQYQVLTSNGKARKKHGLAHWWGQVSSAVELLHLSPLGNGHRDEKKIGPLNITITVVTCCGTKGSKGKHCLIYIDLQDSDMLYMMSISGCTWWTQVIQDLFLQASKPFQYFTVPSHWLWHVNVNRSFPSP